MKSLLAASAYLATAALPVSLAFAQAPAAVVPGASAPSAAPAASAPSAAAAASAPAAAPASADSVNRAQPSGVLKMRDQSAAVLRAEILLDRAHFSPGEIDGRYGSRLGNAVKGFQKANDLAATGSIDDKTWSAISSRENVPALVTYRISDADVAGPFVKIPKKMQDQANLPAMGYQSAQEALGERFHIKPSYLQQMNPGKDLARAGEEIMVPNVDPPTALPRGATVLVRKSTKTVSLLDENGKALAQFPASMGSKHDPLPLGRWKINGVSHHPKFHYNPQLFWDAKDSDSKATIQPGPNNPVGVVWIDLSKAHYGIHGTPEPGNIGKTESHGCIRLSNWDATLLSEAVRPGMPALLVK